MHGRAHRLHDLRGQRVETNHSEGFEEMGEEDSRLELEFHVAGVYIQKALGDTMISVIHAVESAH